MIFDYQQIRSISSGSHIDKASVSSILAAFSHIKQDVSTMALYYWRIIMASQFNNMDDTGPSRSIPRRAPRNLAWSMTARYHRPGTKCRECPFGWNLLWGDCLRRYLVKSMAALSRWSTRWDLQLSLNQCKCFRAPRPGGHNRHACHTGTPPFMSYIEYIDDAVYCLLASVVPFM